MSKKMKIVLSVVVIVFLIASISTYNYLKINVLWKNAFDLKYEGANSSKVFIGGKYTLENKTSNTYSLEYIYVYAEPIIKSGKTVKIKTYKTIYPNSNMEIQISKDDLLEAFELDDVPIWGNVSIKGFEYKKK